MWNSPPGLGKEIGDLLTPVVCAGCGSLDIALCEVCLARLYQPPRRIDGQARYLTGALPTWSSANYLEAQQLILAYKNHIRRDIAPDVEAAARSAGEEWFSAAAADSAAIHHVAEQLLAGACLVLIPAPSGRLRRWRSRLVAADLARAFAVGVATAAQIRLIRASASRNPGQLVVAATELTTSPRAELDLAVRMSHLPPSNPVRIATADILRKPVRAELAGHLAPLGAADRASARRDAVRVISPLKSRDIALIIDDVVTTGATLAASAKALRRAGIRVVGAWTLAATPANAEPTSP